MRVSNSSKLQLMSAYAISQHSSFLKMESNQKVCQKQNKQTISLIKC